MKDSSFLNLFIAATVSPPPATEKILSLIVLFEIAKKIAKNTSEGKVYSVLGGGDTVSVINKINLFESYNFVSTAGGAFLEYLEGKELPGIKALN